MSWQVFLAREAEKNLKKLPANVTENVKAAIREIIFNPFTSGKSLQGALKGQYSFRIGDYRIVYSIDQKAKNICVLYIRHRRDAYRY